MGVKGMRILYHHRTQGQRAEGVHIRGVVQALRNRGHEVAIVSPPGVDPFLGYEASARQPGAPAAATLLALASRRFPEIAFELLELCYNFFALRRARRVVGNGGIDCIYERYSFFGFVGSRLAKRYNVPLVLEINELTGLSRQRPLAMKRLAGAIERHVCRSADLLVVVSAFLRETLAERGIPRDKILTEPNCVDLQWFRAQQDRPTTRARLALEGKIVFGFSGTFSKWDSSKP